MARLVAERADIVPALGELFRTHGYQGTSLALISERTGLGKGSLYHFFPGGKEEMVQAVLAEIDGWFESEIFAPLRTGEGEDEMAARARIAAMFAAVDAYFRSGRRACLIGTFALGQVRERFTVVIDGYFWRWQVALAGALARAGVPAHEANGIAEEVLVGIQGGIVLAHARDDAEVFRRTLERLRARCRFAL
ncbi:TetR/AcrR family transcriptional regulator [Ancylobacter amanitiformis]|uniref:AcrR family transcriptional regulator n=1 Tax=Ancylobacter amanitiformis TaxID=217069 RepID=A0ABU0LRP1_9HYPH|nr:TetR/AcrR family transcriptional regulator [Ancylobacter amanitiformis]MDQ0511375.1 AcrR family transcriptional regulator [Ancylobacter amanitiformis]